MSPQFLVLFQLLALLPSLSQGHGRLMDPPARNSMWRLGFSNPVNYNDNELYCGGRMTQWFRNNGKCGVCGDPYHKPREHEVGGKYANGIITRDYVEGDVIPVSVLITANHQGYFEFRICPVENPKEEVTQECLNKHLLPIKAGQGAQYRLDMGKNNHYFNYSLKLPPGLTCKHCVLQWKYRTGNTWDKDPSGKFCVGCGPQEEFYNCADVAVHRGSIKPRPANTKPAPATGKKIGAGTKPDKSMRNPYNQNMLEPYRSKTVMGNPLSWAIYRSSLPTGNGLTTKPVSRSPKVAQDKRRLFAAGKSRSRTEESPATGRTDRMDLQASQNRMNPMANHINNNNNNNNNMRVSNEPFKSSQLAGRPASHAVLPHTRTSKSMSPFAPTSDHETQTHIVNRHSVSNSRQTDGGYPLEAGRNNLVHRGQGSPRQTGTGEASMSDFQQERRSLLSRWRELRLRQLIAWKKSRNAALLSTPTPSFSTRKSVSAYSALGQMRHKASGQIHASDKTHNPNKGRKTESTQVNSGHRKATSAQKGTTKTNKGNQASSVKGNQASSVKGNQASSVKGNQASSVKGNQASSVKGNQASSVKGNQASSGNADRKAPETKKSYVHHKLPYWLVKALRLRAVENRKETDDKPKSGNNMNRKRDKNSSDSQQRSSSEGEDSYFRNDHPLAFNRKQPKAVEASRLAVNRRDRDNRHGSSETRDVSERTSLLATDSQTELATAEDGDFLSSSDEEEESLIRKIVHLVLERRKSERTPSFANGHSGSGQTRKNASKPKLRPNRPIGLGRPVHSTRSRPYTTRMMMPSPTAFHPNSRRRNASPNNRIYQPNGRNFVSSSHKLSPSHYYHRPMNRDPYVGRPGYGEPKTHWLPRNEPDASRDGFGHRQAALYPPAPEAVPFTNLRSLNRDNYVSMGNDMSYSHPYPNAKRLTNQHLPISSRQNVNVPRQPPFQQHQKTPQAVRQENALDKFLPDQYVQEQDVLWALNMHQRQRQPFSGKKAPLVCKGLVQLAGGMDQWCTDNCNANFCPSSMCVCDVEEPELIPVISSFASNPGGIISGVNGVTWVPFNGQNAILEKAEHRPAPYFPKTSVYSNANPIPEGQRMNGVGYKYESAPSPNQHSGHRHPRSSNVSPYYQHQARSSATRLSIPISSSSRSYPTRPVGQRFHRNLPKSLGTRSRPITDFSTGYERRNDVGFIMNPSQERHFRANDQRAARFYNRPQPSSHPQVLDFPVQNYYVQNRMAYRKRRKHQSPYTQHSTRPF